MNDKTRVQNQDDWKRTQIRIPLDLYDAIVSYAETHSLPSINSAMLELMNEGIEFSKMYSEKNELDYLNEIIEIRNKYSNLQDKSIKYQDDLIAAKEELIRLYKILKSHNIDY